MASAVVPPKGLGTSGTALWRLIAGQWAADRVVPDARERRLLTDACREAQMLSVLEAGLAKAIAAGDLVVEGSTGQPVISPFIPECRRSRAQIAALLGKLGFVDPAASGDMAVPIRGLTAAEAGRIGAYRKHHGTTNGLGGLR